MTTETSDLEIEVLAEDIEKGVEGDSSKCAIALALQRKFPEYRPLVDRNYITLFDPKPPTATKHFRLSTEARHFVICFDHNKNQCNPCTLTANETDLGK